MMMGNWSDLKSSKRNIIRSVNRATCKCPENKESVVSTPDKSIRGQAPVGIQSSQCVAKHMDSRLRGNDNFCKRLNILTSIFFLISLFFNPLPVLAKESDSSLNASLDEIVCITCHSKLNKPMREPVIEWQESVHKKADVGCVDCHGGNPLSVKLAMEKTSGFKGKPSREEIPELCGNCHSDNQRMRKYNLKTDQLEVYKSSIHGKLLFENEDENVATCVDCHGAHAVRSKHDPKSSVYRFNIPQTCANCHGDADIMESYNIPHNQLNLYITSVHGKKLLKEQNLFVPTCVDCHGGHAIVKPGAKERYLICSTCHSEIFEQFQKSPHWNSDEAAAKIYCTNCHNSHDIKNPGIDKFTGSAKSDCGECHEKGSSGFSVGEKIKAGVINAGKKIVAGKESLGTLSGIINNSFELTDLERRLETAKTRMAKIPLITHSLSLTTINKELDEILSIVSATEEDISNKFQELKKRKILLGLIWVFILFIFFLLRKILKTIRYDS